MNEVGIGLIGTGFMGKAHALAYRLVRAVMGDVPTPRLKLLCDTPLGKARDMAEQFGFSDATDSWEQLIQDPSVNLVLITTPNHLHRKIALAAIAAGKHVHFEKPLALTLAEASEIASAAAGVKTILTGPDHAPNDKFYPAPGHQLDFNELKVIEAGALLRHIAGGPSAHPNFAAALGFEKVIHAIADSARTGRPVSI